MKKLNKTISLTVLLAETGHVFCCVLPTIVSVMGLLSGMGIVAALPTSVLAFHEFMHDYEVPVIVGSGVILALGWILHNVSLRMDCHDTGCHHGACTPKKSKTSKMLIIATMLFAANLTIYLLFHG